MVEFCSSSERDNESLYASAGATHLYTNSLGFQRGSVISEPRSEIFDSFRLDTFFRKDFVDYWP